MQKIFLSILVIILSFFLSACSQLEPQSKVIYQERIVYRYLPCECKTTSQLIKIVKKRSNKQKAIKKKKERKRVATKYHQVKPTKIFAPKKFTNRPNKKMDFMIGYNKDKSEFVYMEGEFGEDTFKNFLEFLKQSNTSAKELKINSNGGLVTTAMQIGSYVKEHRWNTGVDKEMHCYSACAFVYFAGKKKSIQGEAKIGLHRPYIPGKADTPQSIAKTKREYLSYWNYIQAPLDLYNDMMDIGRDDLLILTKENIDEYIDVEIE